jgi:DNA-damage-inducible protein J
MSNVTVNARIDRQTKEEAVNILKSLGLNPTDVISMLFKQIIYTKSIPFKIELPPSRDTLKAVSELESGKGVKFDSVDDLFEDLED